MYSVGRVATDKFGCRVMRRPFVGVLSNEDAVLRVAGSAKTVSQPILSENKTELGRASCVRYDVRRTEKLVQSALASHLMREEVRTCHRCQSVYIKSLLLQLFSCPLYMCTCNRP